MTGTTTAKPRKSSTKGKSIVQKNPLPKGQSCATCRARKVRCDAGRPACRACLRTARFEGKDLSTVVCQYDAKVGGGSSIGGGKKGKGRAVASSPGNSTISSSGTARPGSGGMGMSGFHASLDAALAAEGTLAELPPNATLPPMPSATTFSTPSQMYDPSLGGSPYLATAVPPLAYTPTPPLSYSSGEDESIFAYSPPATNVHASGLTAMYEPWTNGGPPPVASTSRVYQLPQQNAPLPPGYYMVPTNLSWYSQGAAGQQAGAPSQPYSGSPHSQARSPPQPGQYAYPSQQYATQHPTTTTTTTTTQSYPTASQYHQYPPASSHPSSATVPPPQQQKPRVPSYQLKKPHLKFELPPPLITSGISPTHPHPPAVSYARTPNDPTFSLPFAQGGVQSPFGTANFHSGLTPLTPQPSYAGMWPTPGGATAALANGQQASGATAGKAGTPGLAAVDDWLRGLQQS